MLPLHQMKRVRPRIHFVCAMSETWVKTLPRLQQSQLTEVFNIFVNIKYLFTFVSQLPTCVEIDNKTPACTFYTKTCLLSRISQRP